MRTLSNREESASLQSSIYSSLLKAVLSIGLLSCNAALGHAQQPQPDGSFMYGGVRLYRKAPPPAEQRAACRDPAQRTLGQLGMSFYGVTPWITNEPLLERNCVTLLDIPPVAFGPFVDEMKSGSQSLWSRVVRTRMPPNPYRWGEGFGFAWCSDRSCTDNILFLFEETAWIGVCRSTPSGTKLALVSPDGNEGWIATTSPRSCITDPRGATQSIAATSSLPGAKRITIPRQPAIEAPGDLRGQSQDEVMRHFQYEVGRERAAADAARLEAERAAAAAQWRRLQQPNELGW